MLAKMLSREIHSYARHSELPLHPRAGVVMHFTSLPSPYGIGDIGDAAQGFLHQLQHLGIAVWQFLPTGPTAYGDSPYQPLSAFAGNEMLIGLEPLVRDGWLQPGELRPLEEMDQGSVDYGAVIPIKQQLLMQAAQRFSAKAISRQQAEYAVFVEQNQDLWLDDYVEYRLLKTQHEEKPWPEWVAAFARREVGAMTAFRRQHQQILTQLKIVQFFFQQQSQALYELADALHIRLFGDMPIYIALDSADAWAHPELLLIDCDGRPSRVAGVPPDYFSEDGQLWGNPLYDWESHAADGYGWWIARTRHALQHCHMLRVDHFRGFESYWAVPAFETTARNGEWLRGPRDGLFLAMESALGRLPIVAENLGVITPEVEGLRLRHQIPGMVVLQFALADPAFQPDQIPPDCVCYTGTHDNDTSKGWFPGGQNDTRTEAELRFTQQQVLRITGGNAASVHLDLIRLAFTSQALLAMVPMQDYLGLGSDSRMNIPGTTLNNWRWRMRADQLTAIAAAEIARLITDAGRSPKRG
jgi:4-alpha-glucanotransferase